MNRKRLKYINFAVYGEKKHFLMLILHDLYLKNKKIKNFPFSDFRVLMYSYEKKITNVCCLWEAAKKVLFLMAGH